MDEVCEAVKNMTVDEKANIAAIFRCDATNEALLRAFETNAKKSFGRQVSKSMSYDRVLEKVAGKVGIKHPDYHSAIWGTLSLESEILQQVFEKTWKRMHSKDRIEFTQHINKMMGEKVNLSAGAGPAAAFAAIALAKSSGFGVYVLATTLVGGLTEYIGVTLPFVFYTGMTSAIKLFLGPIGWLLTGASVVKFAFDCKGQMAYKKVLAAVLMFAAVRARM